MFCNANSLQLVDIQQKIYNSISFTYATKKPNLFTLAIQRHNNRKYVVVVMSVCSILAQLSCSKSK